MLYGQATNTTNIAFQFDKIYETRYSMEQAIYGNSSLNIPKDYIAPGRYVLVSYGYDKMLNIIDGVSKSDDFFPVYTDTARQLSRNTTGNTYPIQGSTSVISTGTFFKDSDCTKVIKYFEFIPVQAIITPENFEENSSSYYILRNGFYTQAMEYDPGETYYQPDRPLTSSEQYITKGMIVRRRFNGSEMSPSNPYPNDYTEEFYVCKGPWETVNPSGYALISQHYPELMSKFNHAAGFEKVVSYSSLAEIGENAEGYQEFITPYLEHYNIDKVCYYDKDGTWGTLHRGYDATVWQKVVGEGVERYILIAHLNGMLPGINIVNEPPTSEPIAPYFGSDSTDLIAQLHMQTPWGFRVKTFDTTFDNPSKTYKSDEYVSAKRYLYQIQEITPDGRVIYQKDEQGNYIHETDEQGRYVTGVKVEPAAIYYNKDGFNRELSVIDPNDNSINVSPGKSLGFDVKYPDYANVSDAGDVQELSINLPVIGNMIAEGYDMLYDKKPFGDKQQRCLDTQWYNASETEFIQQGNILTHPGGKTFNLNTLAGNLNTFHNRLGQIIETIESSNWPKETKDYDALNDNFIYKLGDKEEYYKKGIAYSDEELEYAYRQSSVTQDIWSRDTYYIETNASDSDEGKIYCYIEGLNTSKYLKPCRDESFNSNLTYYERYLANDVYYERKKVVPYVPNTYYYKRGQSYYLSGEQPEVGENAFYYIKEAKSYQFDRDYTPGRFFYKDELDGYSLATSVSPSPNIDYYSIEELGSTDRDLVGSARPYKPFVPYFSNFYYLELTIGSETYSILDVNETPGSQYQKITPDLFTPFNAASAQIGGFYIKTNNGFSKVTSPTQENAKDYYIRLSDIPNEYYYYKLDPNPILTMTADNVLQVTYKVLDKEQLNRASDFGIAYTYKGKEYIPGVTPCYYRDEITRGYKKFTLEKLKEITLNSSSLKNLQALFLNPIDMGDNLFIPNIYWAKTEEGSYKLATEDFYLANLGRTYYDIIPYKIISSSYNKFYEADKYFYVAPDDVLSDNPTLRDADQPMLQQTSTINNNTLPSFASDISSSLKYFYLNNNKYYPLWPGDSPQSGVQYYEVVGSYYVLADLAVKTDLKGEFPPFYKWSSSLNIVPWRFKISSLSQNPALIKMEGFNNGASSLHGTLLALHNTLSLGDQHTRDLSTVQGALNAIEDKVGNLERLTPHKLLTVNEYGRLTSSILSSKELTDVFSDISGQKLTGYQLASVGSPILETDSIRDAFGKIQKSLNEESVNRQQQILTAINNLDSSDSSNSNQIVITVTQTNGIIQTAHDNIGNRTLGGYSGANGINSTDTINEAFNKVQSSLNILNGNASTPGSVSYKIAEIIADAPDSFDTLKEIADWIGNNGSGAEKTLIDYNTRITNLETVSHSHNNKNILDTITQEKVNSWDAKQDVIQPGTYDAFGAANAAEQNAKNYADSLAVNYEDAGAVAAVVGTSEDEKETLTLNGLLKYIQELEQRIELLENPNP